MQDLLQFPRDMGIEKAELQAVLGSELFTRAPGLVKLLSYLCQKYFDGETDQIKEYTIAVDFFKKTPDFDSQESPIVRVEVGRLRAKLKEYYRTEGRDHPIQLTIAPGHYVPDFQRQGAAEAAAAEVARISQGAGFHEQMRAPGEFEWRIVAGSPVPRYLDRIGKIWSSDNFFVGGEILKPTPSTLQRAEDSHLCKQARQGDFEYAIPLKPGVYELHLYFAEMQIGFEPEEGGESSRLFHVLANGSTLLDSLDVFSDVGGGGRVDERVFTDISPAEDGLLHLAFRSARGKAFVNGLEILPGLPGRMHPVRITTRTSPYVSSDQQLWEPDRYYRGGRTVVRLNPVEAPKDPELYQCERFGNFTYSIPLAKGKYRLTLKFAETYFGSANPLHVGPEKRIFSVFAVGRTLLKDFDITKEAGGANRALDRVFHGLQPNAQGKLILNFVPTVNYACVNALEVVAE